MFADLAPNQITDANLVTVMIEFTSAILAVVGIGIVFFALWSKKEKAKRSKDVNTAINLKR